MNVPSAGGALNNEHPKSTSATPEARHSRVRPVHSQDLRFEMLSLNYSLRNSATSAANRLSLRMLLFNNSPLRGMYSVVLLTKSPIDILLVRW